MYVRYNAIIEAGTYVRYTCSMRRHEMRSAEMTRERERRRREAEIRRHILLLVTVSAVMIICAAILIFGIRSRAAEKNAETGYKYYTSITVSDGEDLQDIADRYFNDEHYSSTDAYIDEVCAINHYYQTSAELPELHAGDHLIVPYYSDAYLQ
jgi:hypothetical protein